MIDPNFLFEKHKNSIIYSKEGTDSLKILMQLVDLDECCLNVISNKHLELAKFNTIHSIYFNKKENDEFVFRLFEIKNNKKSLLYYNSLSKVSSIPYFLNSEKIYVLWENKYGIVDTNCDLLKIDWQIQKGISIKTVEQKDLFFMDYISLLENRKLFI